MVGVPDFLFGIVGPLDWEEGATWSAEAQDLFSVEPYRGLRDRALGPDYAPTRNLPGPVQVFTSLPDARAVFTYPMSIAPMIGVPLFVLVNLWVAWRLWEQGAGEKKPAMPVEEGSSVRT